MKTTQFAFALKSAFAEKFCTADIILTRSLERLKLLSYTMGSNQTGNLCCVHFARVKVENGLAQIDQYEYHASVPDTAFTEIRAKSSTHSAIIQAEFNVSVKDATLLNTIYIPVADILAVQVMRTGTTKSEHLIATHAGVCKFRLADGYAFVSYHANIKG